MSDDKVVSLDDRRPHMSGEARCLCCGHKWVAIAPIGTVELECTECNTYRGVFIGPPKPDTVWQCDCGNQLFYIGPDGAMCAWCGVKQVF